MHPLTPTLSISWAPAACRPLAGSVNGSRPALRKPQATGGVGPCPAVPQMDVFRSAITGLL